MTILSWRLLLLLLLFVCLGTTRTIAEQVCGVEDDCQQEQEKSWFEDSSKEGIKFLKEKVFGQKPDKKRRALLLEQQESFESLFASDEPADSGSTTSATTGGGDGSILETLKSLFEAEEPDKALLEFLLSNGAGAKEEKQQEGSGASSSSATARLFLDHGKEIINQLQRIVGDRVDHLVQKYFFLPSVWFLLRADTERKNAYWKQSQHRFFPKTTDTEYFKELHRGLYLSNLAYVGTQEELEQGLQKVDDNNWQLIFADLEGNPKEPAHFIAVQKQTDPLPKASNNNNQEEGTGGFWQKLKSKLGDKPKQASSNTLKVLLVVRGTKSVGDVLSDGLLEATPYKEKYKAHGGIASSGQYLVHKHLARLQQLAQASGGRHLQLLLLGHSLGCGTAAIAAMELHDNYSHIMTVRALGFGCPSLVSPELSHKYKDVITTVIADADVVPRLSGSSIVNLHLSMMSLDWTDYMMQELSALGADILKDIQSSWGEAPVVALATDLLVKMGDFIQEELDKIKPLIQKCRDEEIPNSFPRNNQRVDNELVPPGTCLHLYRTATGFDAAYTPCEFF